MSRPSETTPPSLGLSGARVIVRYLLQASGSSAQRTAEVLCIDQTVESAEEIIPDGPIRESLIGRVESLEAAGSDQSTAAISFPIELLGRSGAECLHLLFGTSSLKPGIRVVGLELPADVLPPFHGPRFGRVGLRGLLGVPNRPLVCAVLKPLGLPPDRLASLAREFALGGVDWIKDDQGMTDQPFCRFQDRVAACAEAVSDANRTTDGSCRYVAHVSGAPEEVRERARYATRAGAGGLLICPGLTGYDALRALAADRTIGLPIFSHPALLGTYGLDRRQGIAPAVLYGTLPRVMGADVSIYPTWGADFGIGRDDCARIAEATETPRIPVASMFPTAAGRIGLEHIEDIRDLYGHEVVYILGSRIQRDREGLRQACRRFIAAIDDRPGRLPD